MDQTPTTVVPDAEMDSSSATRAGVVLVLSLLLVGWLLAGPTDPALLNLGGVALASCIVVVSRGLSRGRIWETRGMILAAAIAIAVEVIAVSINVEFARLIGAFWMFAVGLLAPFWLARGLRLRRRLDLQVLLAAISIYVLIGLAFTMVYALIGITQETPMYRTADGLVDGDFQDKVYFSFVTMSTTGYGDFAPYSGSTRATAMLEALTGQFYLVVGVAAIVSLLLNQRAAEGQLLRR